MKPSNEWVAYYRAEAVAHRATAEALRISPYYRDNSKRRESLVSSYEAMAADYDRRANEEAADQREVA